MTLCLYMVFELYLQCVRAGISQFDNNFTGKNMLGYQSRPNLQTADIIGNQSKVKLTRDWSSNLSHSLECKTFQGRIFFQLRFPKTKVQVISLSIVLLKMEGISYFNCIGVSDSN